MSAVPSQREFQMERIIRHFLGEDISLDPARLEETADLLESGRYRGTPPETRGVEDEDQTPESYSLEPLSTNTMRMSKTLFIRAAVNWPRIRLFRGIVALEFLQNDPPTSTELGYS